MQKLQKYTKSRQKLVNHLYTFSKMSECVVIECIRKSIFDFRCSWLSRMMMVNEPNRLSGQSVNSSYQFCVCLSDGGGLILWPTSPVTFWWEKQNFRLHRPSVLVSCPCRDLELINSVKMTQWEFSKNCWFAQSQCAIDGPHLHIRADHLASVHVIRLEIACFTTWP